MQITSLRIATELFFWRYTAEVRDRGHYLRIETPSNPSFYAGNCLVFERPPLPDQLPGWEALFHDEFRHRPEVRHVMFEWQEAAEPAALEAFQAAGFELESNITLVYASPGIPPHRNPEVLVRPLQTEQDWDAMLELQVLCRGTGWAEPAFRHYMAGRLRVYRALVDEGAGRWYGAFLGGQLVADLGLFWEGALARFQAVETHPAYRRRGICTTLLEEVCLRALDQGLEQLVLVADEHYHAIRVYRSVGFVERERSGAAFRRPLPLSPCRQGET